MLKRHKSDNSLFEKLKYKKDHLNNKIQIILMLLKNNKVECKKVHKTECLSPMLSLQKKDGNGISLNYL